MHTSEFSYHDNDTLCHGYIAYDDSHTGVRPVVMIVHAFEGRNELACDYARKVAELGYIGFAVDMYGHGQIADSLDGCLELMRPLFNDRALLQQRIVSAYEAIKTLEVADSSRIACMGFCFGGMTSLDLARAGVDLKAAISIHGVFAAPKDVAVTHINAKVLCLHGYKDPQVGPENLSAFAEEMDQFNVDWQVHFFGHAQHAFTDPDAAKIGPPEMGRVYDPLASARSWQYCTDLFQEVF